MAEREVFYADSLARTTYTGTTNPQNSVALTWQPKANTAYFILWGMTLDCTSGITVSGRLNDVTGAVAYPVVGRVNSANDRLQAGGAIVRAFAAAPANQTWQLQYILGTSSQTIGVQDAWILVIEKLAEDFQVYTAGEVTTTSNTYQNGVELAFTPPTAGDYLIIATGQLNASATAQVDAQFNDGVAPISVHTKFVHGNSSSYMPVWILANLTLAASAKSLKLEYRSSDGVSTAKVRERVIIALRRDAGFTRTAYAESRARATTTGTTMIDKAVLSADFLNAATYLLACGVLDQNINAQAGVADVVDNGVTLGSYMSRQTGVSYTSSLLRGYRDTPTTRAQTWKTRFATLTGATTAGFADSALFAFSVGGGKLREGAAVPGAVKLGSSHVNRVYLGTTQLWGF